jgi:hypothetical protein
MSITFTTIRPSRRATAIVAALCVALSSVASAHARPATEDAADMGRSVASRGMYESAQSKIGDTPADFGKTVSVPLPKIGDTPADFGKPVSLPQTVEIVKPERTIIRDTDPALPIVLSGLALLVALAGGAQVLANRRTLHGHPH